MAIGKANRLKCRRGFTILEVLIAAAITGILATASFRFYTSMHNQTEVQYEVSEVQHLCRSSVNEIKKTLRLAGFKLSTHDAYEIKGDTLAIYYSDTQPVDTVMYYLQEFNDYEYSKVHGLSEEVPLYKLMKRENGDTPSICADFIRNISFTQIDSRTIEISVTAQVSKSDDSFEQNNGFRTWTLDEQVSLRNVNL